MMEIKFFGPTCELILLRMGLNNYLLMGGEMMDSGGGMFVIPESNSHSEVVDGWMGHEYIS